MASAAAALPPQAEQEKLCELLVTALQELARRREEDANKARDHRQRRERVVAAERDCLEAEANAESKHTGRTAPSYHQIQLAKRKLADAEESLVKSMKALERRHALAQPYDEDVRAARVVLQAAQDLTQSLSAMQRLRATHELAEKQRQQIDELRQELEASQARAARLEATSKTASQRVAVLEQDANQAQGTIKELKARLAESEDNCAPLYELVPKLRQQADELRAQLRDHGVAAENWAVEREQLEKQIASEARAQAQSEAEAQQLRQELMKTEASAARELAEREAELHRFYAAQLVEAERAAGEPEQQVDMLANQLHTLRMQLHQSAGAKEAAEHRMAAAESRAQEAEQDLAARIAADADTSKDDDGQSDGSSKNEAENEPATTQEEAEDEPVTNRESSLAAEDEPVTNRESSLAASIADERKQLTALKERVLRDRERAEQRPPADADETQSPQAPVLSFTRAHQTCVLLSADGTDATKREGGGMDNGTSRTAASQGLARKGRHFAEFTILCGNDIRVGVIRPGWDIEAGGDAWAVHGHCMYHVGNGAKCPGQKDWDGRQRAQKGDRIGLLLDLDQGCMSVYKNGSRLGLLQRSGLSGQFCWAATLHNEGDAVHIQGNPEPAYAVPETVESSHPNAEEQHDDPFHAYGDDDGSGDNIPSTSHPQRPRQALPADGRYSKQPKKKPPPPPQDQLQQDYQSAPIEIPSAASARAPAAGRWGTGADEMAGDRHVDTSRTYTRAAAYPNRSTAGFEGFSSFTGVGAGGISAAPGQNMLIQQQHFFADTSTGAEPTTLAQHSTQTTAPSAHVQQNNQEGVSHVYLNPNSMWVQHADSGGQPWFYNSETAEVTFSPPREGVLRVEG